MKSHSVLSVITSLLILLFIYAAVSKWLDFDRFQRQMQLQALPLFLRFSAPWFLPPLELVTGLLLLYQRTRRTGLYFALALLATFSIYILLALLQVYPRVPCSCGGVLKYMGWRTHFFFNLFFLLLTLVGIFLENRERRTGLHQ